MTDADSPGTEESSVPPEGTASDLLASLGVSILTGVAVVPLILPGGNGEQRFFLSKFQLQDSQSEVVYEGLIPLDVLTMLALNFLKACHTAFGNLGEVEDKNLIFIDMDELAKAAEECGEALRLLSAKFKQTKA